MTLNAHFWGDDSAVSILTFLERFDTEMKANDAEKCFKAVCLQTLAGIINHMAPAGQRMPELAAISLLEQPVCIQLCLF